MHRKLQEMAVREVRQSASGGSSYVKYQATFELTSELVINVELACCSPDYISDDDVSSAIDAIRLGFEQVLFPRQEGARVDISDITIHPVDFKLYRYTKATEVCLRKVLGYESDV